MEKQFKNSKDRLKSNLPNLDEGTIKQHLRTSVYKQSKLPEIDDRVKDIIIAFKDSSYLINETKYVSQSVERHFKRSYDLFIDDKYNSYKRGNSLSNTEIYERQMFLLNDGGGEFFIKWDINKAMKLIKEENLKKVQFSIDKMNIAEEEIEEDHLKIAIHNKKPGIVISYAPYKEGSPYYHYLVDGNHRIIAKSRADKSFTNAMVFLLSDLQTFKALHHPYDESLFLIHLLSNLSLNVLENNLDEIEKYYARFRAISNLS
jgi:hypothetical protein